MIKKLCLIFALNFLKFYTQSAEEIIAKNLEVTGGLANWKQLNSIQLNAKSQLSLTEEYDIQIFQKAPNLTKTKILINKENITTELFDGKNAYSYDFKKSKLIKNPFFTPESFESDFIDYQTKSFKIEKLADENFKGIKCFKVKFTKDKSNTIYWFDANTYHLLREEKADENLYYSDFKKVQKLVFPFRIQSVTPNGKEDYNLLINKIIPNVKFDDKVFKN